MTKRTICDGLGVENRTEEQRSASVDVAFKIFHDPDYDNAMAVMDMLKIYGITDTPETRKIAAEMFSFGATVSDLSRSLKP